MKTLVSSDRAGANRLPGFRRRIRIVPQVGVIGVDLEDDFHRFGVTLHHAEGRVMAVETREIRYPWTTCPAAAAFLRERMVGTLLTDAGASEDQRQHCTHLYDLFVLAAAHADDSISQVLDISVSDPVDGVRIAEIARDTRLLLRWRVGGSPDDGGMPSSDRDLRDWCRDLPLALQEPARMLRRGLLVSRGRHSDWSPDHTAADIPIKDVCFTFQTVRSANAQRNGDPRREFSGRSEDLLRS